MINFFVIRFDLATTIKMGIHINLRRAMEHTWDIAVKNLSEGKTSISTSLIGYRIFLAN